MSSFKKQREQENQLAAVAGQLDRAKAERSAQIQLHLQKLGEEQAEDERMLDVVVQAAVNADGIPGEGALEAFASRAEALAARLCTARRTREWSQVRKLFDELNARDPNIVMVHAAKRAGVELVPPAPVGRLTTIDPGGSNLVTEG